jgi:cyclase
VVKGVHFKNLKEAGDPVELAKSYDGQGADELCFLDVTASCERRDIMLNVVKDVAEQVFIPFTVGGGIRSLEDIREILKAGADKVSICTAGVQNPRLIRRASEKFGSQCIVASVDAMRPQEGENWQIFVNGGRDNTGLDALGWAKRVEKLGAGEIMLNAMEGDGTQRGYCIDFTREVSESVGIPVIASGGAGNPEDIYEALTRGKADAALAASIFHFGTYTVGDVKSYLKKRGVNVRP